jgi:hypothetical protein
MSDVVDINFKRKNEIESYCFTCGCGGQKFVLRPDAKIECAECLSQADQLIWGQYFVSKVFPP